MDIVNPNYIHEKLSRVDALRKEGMMSLLIVSCLPFLVATMLSVANFKYLSLLFTQDGLFFLAIAVFLLLMNTLTMLKMIRAKSEEEAVTKLIKLGPNLTIPMVLFLLPCMFTILIGPAILQVKQMPLSSIEGAEVTSSTVADVSTCIINGTSRIVGLTADGYSKIVSECGVAFRK